MPAYLDLVRRQLRQEYREEDLTTRGLSIFTAFDPLLQRDYFRLQAFFAPLHMPEHAVAATPAERAEWQALADYAFGVLVGKSFDKATWEAARGFVAEYRRRSEGRQ